MGNPSLIVKVNTDRIEWDTRDGSLAIELRAVGAESLWDEIQKRGASLAFNEDFQAAVANSVADLAARFQELHPKLQRAQEECDESDRKAKRASQKIDEAIEDAVATLDGEGLTAKLCELESEKDAIAQRREVCKRGLELLREKVSKEIVELGATVSQKIRDVAARRRDDLGKCIPAIGRELASLTDLEFYLTIQAARRALDHQLNVDREALDGLPPAMRRAVEAMMTANSEESRRLHQAEVEKSQRQAREWVEWSKAAVSGGVR